MNFMFRFNAKFYVIRDCVYLCIMYICVYIYMYVCLYVCMYNMCVCMCPSDYSPFNHLAVFRKLQY